MSAVFSFIWLFDIYIKIIRLSFGAFWKSTDQLSSVLRRFWTRNRCERQAPCAWRSGTTVILWRVRGPCPLTIIANFFKCNSLSIVQMTSLYTRGHSVKTKWYENVPNLGRKCLEFYRFFYKTARYLRNHKLDLFDQDFFVTKTRFIYFGTFLVLDWSTELCSA